MSQNENDEQQTEISQEQMEAIVTWFKTMQQVLEQQFDGYEVEGQMADHPA